MKHHTGESGSQGDENQRKDHIFTNSSCQQD